MTFQSTLPRGERHEKTQIFPIANGFNPRSRVGSDLTKNSVRHWQLMFQSTPPRGERHAKSIVSPLPETVSIHAPAWGATDVLYRSYVHLLVSIHAPAWGATERPLTDSEAQGVSIHAPAWGATPRRSCLSRRAIVSIHAPAWGATLRISFASSQVSFQSTSPRGERHDIITTTLLHDYFNPRPRVGSDRRHDRPVYRVRISIHVPAWGPGLK